MGVGGCVVGSGDEFGLLEDCGNVLHVFVAASTDQVNDVLA